MQGHLEAQVQNQKTKDNLCVGLSDVGRDGKFVFAQMNNIQRGRGKASENQILIVI